jgi:hypothetical protein
MSISKYRKKPVEIEAMKFEYTQERMKELQQWMGESFGRYSKARHPLAKGELEVRTLEDGEELKVVHIATEGDYIIKGVQGEFYACKPDIFDMTYEKV